MKSSLLNSKYVLFDCSHTDSHVQFNSELIKGLSTVGDVNLFSWNSSYNHLIDQSISIRRKKYLTVGFKNALLARLVLFFNTILNAIYLRSRFKKNEVSFVLIGYEIISFALCSFLFPKEMFVIHHMQVDELNNSMKRFFFSFFKNRIKHVVMTDYIKDNLVTNLSIPSNLVGVVPHPIYDFNFDSISINSDIRTFISLNYSIDESYVEKIIELESQNNYFSRNGCKLIIKSKLYKHSSEGLYVFNDFLESDEYYELYKNCTCVISLLNDSFEYRMSGTLIDALSANKPIMSLSSICANHYRKYFGNSIMIYDNFDELIEEIVNFRPSSAISSYPVELVVDYRAKYIDNIQKVFI
ncbi:MAG: hypothetical protein KA210_02370 [Bacteroidia bacterium]|nr:hypothetical protein [Bacteroidia bacterium]